MKKFWLSCFCLGLCGLTMAAESKTGASPQLQPAPAVATPAEKWDFFQFCCWPDYPPGTSSTAAYGIRLGVPFSGGTTQVVGAEIAVLGAMSDYVDGFQGSLITALTRDLNGAQVSLVNIADYVDGFQFGIFNMAQGKSFQIGLLNYIEDGAFPVLPIINFKF